VVETNGLITALLVEQWGARYRYRNIVTDARELIEAALLRDIDADLILTTGGTSVGIRDLVPEAVRKLGKLLVHGLRSALQSLLRLGLWRIPPSRVCLDFRSPASSLHTHLSSQRSIVSLTSNIHLSAR